MLRWPMSGAEAGHHGESRTLEGWSADLTDPALDEAARGEILEKAFDFRGDVTLTLRDGRVVEGYLFDRRKGATPGASAARIMPVDPAAAQVTVAYAEIASVRFGKDAAHGKTWENWVKRYVEKKRKGEAASIEAEVL